MYIIKMDSKVNDYIYDENKQHNFSIDEIKNVFKLPIHYLKDKSTLETNIHSDLELTELKDNSNNCLYDNVFEPKNQLSKTLV